jgi:hypothetical protein
VGVIIRRSCILVALRAFEDVKNGYTGEGEYGDASNDAPGYYAYVVVGPGGGR